MKSKETTVFLLLHSWLCFAPGSLESRSFKFQVALDSRGLPLRWDNIEGSPLWVDGVSPQYSNVTGYHQVRLDPGKSTTVWLSEKTVLRVSRGGQALSPRDLRAWVWRGSGLELEIAPIQSNDKSSLLFYPRSLNPVLVRVARPVSHSGPLEFGLFVSRVEFESRKRKYREIVPLSGEVSRISTSRLQAGERYWPGRAEPLVAGVQGPATFALRTRLVYPGSESNQLQSYLVRVFLDGEWSTFDLVTTPEISSSLRLDSEEVALGAERTVYFKVPRGFHEVKIEHGERVYSRLLRSSTDDFLLGAPTEHFPTQPLLSGFPEDTASAPTLDARALQCLRDNSKVGNRLLGSMYFHGVATELSTHPEDRAVAAMLYRRYSRYRNLYPLQKNTPGAQRRGLFVVPRMLKPVERSGDLWLSQPHLGDALKGMSLGAFLELPASRASGHTYPLPARRSPSMLRIAVIQQTESGAAEFPSEIMVRLDSRRPMLLRTAGCPDSVATAFRPTRAEAAFAALGYLHPPFTTTTFYGPLSKYRPVFPFFRVAVAEIPIDETVQKVRLWTTQADTAPRAAVQYLADDFYTMSESEYLETAKVARDVDPGANVMVRCFELWARGEVPESSPWQKLTNEWLPLFRFLKQAQDNFRSGMAPPEAPPGSPSRLEEYSTHESRASAAVEFEKMGEWLLALEAWSIDLQSENPEDYRLARMRSVAMLEALGEHFLARKQLKGIFLYEPNESLREEALERLVGILHKNEDRHGLLRVLSTAALDGGNPSRLRLLAETLADEGLHPMALMIGLSLPPAEQPLSLLLRCASRRGWWGVFESAQERLADDPIRHYWQGIREVERARYERALTHLDKGGPTGKALAQSLRQALNIRDRLANEGLEERCRAILEWEEWQKTYPGKKQWTADMSILLDYAGAETAYSPSRDVYRQYVRGTPERPVKVGVLGPVTVRIEARPVHTEQLVSPLDGWLTIREEGFLHTTAIIGNLPNRSLTLTGSSSELPGMRVLKDLTLGPGFHEIEVGSPTLDILVRVLTEEPEIALGVLPPLTPSTLGAALGTEQGARLSSSPQRSYSAGVRFKIEEPHLEEIELPVARLGALLAETLTELPSDIDDLLRARMALRVGTDGLIVKHGDTLRRWARSEDAPEVERLLVLARLGEVPRIGRSEDASESSAIVGAAEAAALAAGEFLDAMHLPLEEGDGGVIRRLALLLYIAEKEPDLRSEAQVLGEALVKAHPQLRGLQSLYHRLTRSSGWKKVAAVRDGAGIRKIETRGWQPENPELRVRKALLAPFEDDERLITGNITVRISMSNLAPTTLHLDLFLETAEYVPKSELAVLYQLDAGEPTRVVLSSNPGPPRLNPPVSVEVSIPEGNHVIRLWIQEPIVNHFVRVRIQEVKESDAPEGFSEGFPATFHRTYQVATPERPLRLAVQGPVSLLVNEFRDHDVVTGYRSLPEGWHEVVLHPAGDQKEALFRVFERVEEQKREPSSPPSREAEPAPVPHTDLRLDFRNHIDNLTLHDALALGGQEDGTFSLGVLARKRRQFDEGTSENENYLELLGAYKYFYQPLHTYSDTGFLVRVRRNGGPTLGFVEDLHSNPRWLPFTLRLAGAAYLQWPNGSAVGPSGPLEWSATLRGAISRRFPLGLKAYHAPSVSLFGRLLSLDDFDSFKPKDVDQDVFTPYKSNHKAGLVFSERVGVLPWQDTEWWARASLVSNEDLNPGDADQFATQLGWKQFIDGWLIDVQYRYTRFFNDSNRNRTFDRHAIGLQVLRDFWASPRDRLEAGVGFRHDFKDDVNTGFLFLAWHFSNGRGYRDFWPGDVDFLPLRKAREPAGQRNSVMGARNE